MSRALIALRDHARRLAAGESVRVSNSALSIAADGLKAKSRTLIAHPDEMALWAQIANEIDAFLDCETPAHVDGQIELPT